MMSDEKPSDIPMMASIKSLRARGTVKEEEIKKYQYKNMLS